jgi:hypothetical protein
MIRTARFTLILLALASAATPALAQGWSYRHNGWYGNYDSYNYGGPHYTTSDYYNNSRMLNGTR